MHSVLDANVSGTPYGLNVRKMLILSNRINLESAQHVGAPNDRMHHQEIMLQCCSLPELQDLVRGEQIQKHLHWDDLKTNN